MYNRMGQESKHSKLRCRYILYRVMNCYKKNMDIVAVMVNDHSKAAVNNNSKNTSRELHVWCEELDSDFLGK